MAGRAFNPCRDGACGSKQHLWLVDIKARIGRQACADGRKDGKRCKPVDVRCRIKGNLVQTRIAPSTDGDKIT
mgnify:CR=1 FL=1